MKIQLDGLVRFIDDFKLEKDGVICFEVVIVFTTQKRQVQLPSEIHIIHLNQTGMDVIYLLDPDVTKHGIPDVITDTNSIEYKPNEFLYIKSATITDGKYILSIHPISSKCEPDTLKELYAKTYN